jgi:LuxR family maltose regulon positive regulatory protein
MMAQVLADSCSRSGNVAPLVRARLLERLDAAARFPITLIIAPAGYGKSVLLRQHLETTHEPNVCFTLRAEHGELLGFLRGFTEALGKHAPHALTTLAGAYERNQTSPRRAEDLARWMQVHLEESFSGTIAIDDLHNGENDPDIARFVMALIGLCRERISWVLASRSTAGLPVASWLAYKDADVPIDEADLRFTLDEGTTAASEAGLRIGQDEMRNLLQITEGWPAALTFALATSTRSSDLRNVSAVTREMT